MQTPPDERFAQLSDGALPATVRRDLLDNLMRADNGAIVTARKQGWLNADWPDNQAARSIGGDDLFLLAVCMPEEKIASVLEEAKQVDIEQLVLAVRLASAVAHFDPAAAEHFEPLLRVLLGDGRKAFPWLDYPDESLGAYTQTHHLQVISALAENHPQRYNELIQLAIRASLERGREEASLYNVFHNSLNRGLSPACLAQVLTDILADADAAPTTRISARKALDVLAGIARHPDGAPPSMLEDMSKAYEVAGAHLEKILRDPGSPEMLRTIVEVMVYRWAPNVHLQLQREAVLSTLPIPSRRQHKDWTPAGIESLARQVSYDEAVALLGNPKEDELDRMITVLRIAPSFTAWLSGALECFVPLFVALLSSQIPVPMKSCTRTLGDMAFEKFPELFPPIDSQPPNMQQMLYEGLAVALATKHDLSKIEDWLPNLLTPQTMKKLGIRS